MLHQPVDRRQRRDTRRDGVALATLSRMKYA